MCDLEVCIFVANTSAISIISNQKSLPRATIGSCVVSKIEKEKFSPSVVKLFNSFAPIIACVAGGIVI